MREFLARSTTLAFIGVLYATLPLLPVLASICFLRRKYVFEYATTIRRLVVHIRALREGPASLYFGAVLKVESPAQVEVQGSCVRCGNCCMDRRCVFLQQVNDTEYECGIYHSPFRRFSNCGSFPLNQYDIDRYACPSYYVVEAMPVRFVHDMGELQSAN